MACKQHLWCVKSLWITRFNFLVVIFASFFCVVLTDCPEDDLYIIKSVGNSDMVLEGKDSLSMTVQYFSNSSSQLWKFQRGSRVGYYNIINNQTGKALDYQAENSKYQLVLVGKTKRKTPRQEWSVRIDGIIQNRENRRCIDIYSAIFVPGNRVIVVQDYGNLAQKFYVENYKDFNFEEWKDSEDERS